MGANFHDHQAATPADNSFLLLLVAGLLVSSISCGAVDWLYTSPDCSTLTDVTVSGMVQDIKGKPIANAGILIRSKRQTQCPNSVPIEDIHLLSDEEGTFSYILPTVSEDDILEMSVTADGYRPYDNDYVTIEDISERLVIVLRE